MVKITKETLYSIKELTISDMEMIAMALDDVRTDFERRDRLIAYIEEVL